MRIAQVAPLSESVPPKYYGGTERVVSYITEELVNLGHDVTLFASGDSQTAARLLPQCPQALRLDPSVVDPLAHHVRMIEEVFEHAAEFDVIHFHLDYLHFPLVRRQPVRALTTLHGRLDLPDLVPIFRKFPEAAVSSISLSQRAPLPWLNWQASVHHGLPGDLYPFSPTHGGYLAFLGRVSPEKRVDRAIRIACQAGIPLKIAAKVDKVDRDYFDESIQPLLGNPGVEFIGEIGEAEKAGFLGNALGLLFPIDWPEPFGLVMIEAMACGTPVIAYRNGSVPEVLEHGVTGFVVDDLNSAVAAVGKLHSFDRARCRSEFERRFHARRMAEDYLAVYESLPERMPHLVKTYARSGTYSR